jgi:hypothetical protein
MVRRALFRQVCFASRSCDVLLLAVAIMLAVSSMTFPNATAQRGPGSEKAADVHPSKSPNKRNRNHPSMIFPVRVDGLRPGTTYYYTVEAVQANGIPDGVKSAVNPFTTPAHP